MAAENADDIEVVEITHGELIKIHASAAARALGLHTEDFLARWESGELDETIASSSHPDVVRWEMLMSFGRKQPSRSG